MRMVSQRPRVFYTWACRTQARRCPALVPDRDGLETRGLRWEGHGTSRCAPGIWSHAALALT
ncbi:MAG: hypothetical protein ACXVDN_25635, partial [Ktedonobacteraceae bacterium]